VTSILIFLLAFCGWVSYDAGHVLMPWAFLGAAVGMAVVRALEAGRTADTTEDAVGPSGLEGPSGPEVRE
jgi:hypothetical protein